MGEIADMMLDGTLCQYCGEFMGGDGDGFPVVCPGCQQECDVDEFGNEQYDTTCQICSKRLKTPEGLQQHMNDKHGK